MSELIIIGYDDPDSAKKAYDQVLQLQRDYVVNLNGLALVSVDADGKKHVDTPSRIVGVSAASGALWGAVLGILFLVPSVGMLIGGAVGALMGKLSKSGINDFAVGRGREGVGRGTEWRRPEPGVLSGTEGGGEPPSDLHRDVDHDLGGPR